MKSISLKLKEHILSETDALLEELKKSRNSYINEALAFYNKHHQRELLKSKLRKESILVTDNSIAILNEFERLVDEV